MSKSSLAAGVSPFAHLLAGAAALGNRVTGRRAEDEKPEDDEARKAKRAEEDERRQQEDARRAEEDEKRKEEDARRAEEDGDDETAEDEEDKSDASKAKGDDQKPSEDADDGDDDGDCDDEKSKKAYRRGLATGRARENLRASRIFGHPAAAARPDLAATLAFTTRNPSAAAGNLLTAAATPVVQPRGSRLDDRMGNRTEARPGADGGPQKLGFGERVLAAVKKAGAA